MIFINFLIYAYQWKNTTLQFLFLKIILTFDDEDSQKMHLLIYYFNT